MGELRQLRDGRAAVDEDAALMAELRPLHERTGSARAQRAGRRGDVRAHLVVDGLEGVVEHPHAKSQDDTVENRDEQREYQQDRDHRRNPRGGDTIQLADEEPDQPAD